MIEYFQLCSIKDQLVEVLVSAAEHESHPIKKIKAMRRPPTSFQLHIVEIFNRLSPPEQRVIIASNSASTTRATHGSLTMHDDDDENGNETERVVHASAAYAADYEVHLTNELAAEAAARHAALIPDANTTDIPQQPEEISRCLSAIANNNTFIGWTIRRTQEDPIVPYSENQLPVDFHDEPTLNLHIRSILALAEHHKEMFVHLSCSEIDISLSICLLYQRNVTFRNLLASLGSNFEYDTNGILISSFKNITSFKEFVDHVASTNPSGYIASRIICSCVDTHPNLVGDAINYALEKLFRFLKTQDDVMTILNLNRLSTYYYEDVRISRARQAFSYLVFKSLDDSQELCAIKDKVVDIFISAIAHKSHPINIIKEMRSVQNQFHLYILEVFDRLSLAQAPTGDNNYKKALCNVSQKAREVGAETITGAYHYVAESACAKLNTSRESIPDNVTLIIFSKWLERTNNTEEENDRWYLSGDEFLNLTDSKLSSDDSESLRKYLRNNM